MGVMGFSTMSMEMVPPEYRGRWVGFLSLFQNIIRIPTILLGGYIYENIDPSLVFIIPIFVSLLLRIPRFSTIPDTLKRARTVL